MKAIMNSQTLFKNNKKTILNKPVKPFEVVIKGMTIKIAKQFETELNILGIDSIEQMSKNDFRMIKAKCNDINDGLKLIKDKIRLMYQVYQV
jgi:hypothetical protein